MAAGVPLQAGVEQFRLNADVPDREQVCGDEGVIGGGLSGCPRRVRAMRQPAQGTQFGHGLQHRVPAESGAGLQLPGARSGIIAGLLQDDPEQFGRIAQLAVQQQGGGNPDHGGMHWSCPLVGRNSCFRHLLPAGFE